MIRTIAVVIATVLFVMSVDREAPAAGPRPAIAGASIRPLSASPALLTESFAGVSTPAAAWLNVGTACLTAGNATTPAASIPACGGNAPQDLSGQGALQMTGPTNNQAALVMSRTPVSTANGLQITFTDYAFNGSYSGADGLTVFFTDGSKPLPATLGAPGASLGYAGTSSKAGVANAYLGIGLDEFGNFSTADQRRLGGPGRVRETIAVRGAAALGYPYLGGVAAGTVAASLPFSLDQPALKTRPANAPTVQISLTADGALSAAVDHHDGTGFVTYYARTIVGVEGEPAVPASVFIGFTASTGGSFNCHQIGNFSVTASSGASPTPVPGKPLVEPVQLRSQNGTLVFNVSAQSDASTGRPEFNYNGSLIPPTLRVLPGDTLLVNVTDNLPAPPAGAAYMNDISLHYHGLHVNPNAPGDDSIDMIAAPGQSLHYQIKIPANHPTGLYWYHSHAHGETERQTLAGMSGALIVDGIAQFVPQVAALTEQILIVRDAPLPGQALVQGNATQVKAMQWSMHHGMSMGTRTHLNQTALNRRATTETATRNPFVIIDRNYRKFVRPLAVSTHCSVNEAPLKALTIDGQTQPAIALHPGERQFWRLVNAGADTYLDVQVDNAQLQIVALDGVPVAGASSGGLTVNDYVVPPSSRIEFIVTGPAAGAPAFLRTKCFDAGQAGAAMPATVLAAIDPNATPAIVSSAALHRQRVGTFRLPALRSVQALKTLAVARTQTLYYSDQNTINGVAYDPAAPPMLYAQSNTVEEWTIVNNSSQVHTFHIHQLHFVLEAINGATLAQQFFFDNVNVPAATAAGPGSVKILLDFSDPNLIGTFLLHCHILSHEDAGMMAQIRVGTAPPLSLSTATVNFAAATAAAQTVTVSGGTLPYSLSGCAQVAGAVVRGNAVVITAAGAGTCQLTVADSSGLIGSIAVNVAAAAPVLSVLPNDVSFAGTGAASQNVALSGGQPPYSAGGCAGTVAVTIAGSVAGIRPAGIGSCTLTFTDSLGNNATLAVSVNAPAGNGTSPDNLTFHQNAMRTGWYQAERQLTPANVAAANFGLLATLAAPAGLPAFGKVYAQPLYVSGETAGDGSKHNLVVIATSSDQLYAYDDATRAIVWHRDFTNPAGGITQQMWTDSGCGDVNPNVGIVATPVIDRARDVLYVVVPTKENGNFHLRLHAVSMKTGVEATDVNGRQVGPTEVTATYAMAAGGTASVDAANNFARSALLEANGNIYVGLSSHCDYKGNTTHGWMLAYSASSLQQTGNMLDITDSNAAGNYFLGSPWMSGFGPSSDAQGNIYFATGNGPFNGTSNLSMSVVGLPGTLDMTKAKFFSPFGEHADAGADADLGSGGVVLLPDLAGAFPHVLVAGGKCGAGSAAGGTSGCMKYVLNRDNLGGQRAGDSGALIAANTGGGMWGGPAAFQDANGRNYIVYGDGSPLSTYALSTGPLSLAIQSSANVGCLECRDNGSQPIVSSNGTIGGTAVVWALRTPGGGGGPIALYAFDALNMGHTLFRGTAGGWTVGPNASYIGGALVSPLVANGKVYVPVDGGVAVFGLH